MLRRTTRLALTLAALFCAAACGSDDGPERRPAQTRVLVVGWDGATWDLIDPLLAEGRMPNLARMLERGSQAVLESTIVPISSAAWVGAVTGRDPGHSGVYGFFEPVPDTYDVTLISARSVEAPPIWRTLSRRGGRSLVVGVPVTWPPEPIEGVLVSGMLAPKDSVWTWPPALTERLRARGYAPDLGIWRDANEISGEILERQLAAKRELLLELMANEDWDLAFFVFKELDVVSHFAYDGRTDTFVAALYEALDRELGALLAAVGPGVRVLVVSDHGFHAYPTSFFPWRWLVDEGFSVERAPVAEPADLESLPLAQRRSLENASAMDALDLGRTRAFAGLAEGNFGGVRLNLAGREPEGSLAPDQAEATLVELERRLAELRVPGTDRPLVVRTWRREELYPGPFVDLVPDLMFETDPEVAVRPVPHDARFEAHEPRFPDHRRDGILIAAGPGLAAVAERGRASILDVGPTALHLMGHAVYRELEGRVLTDLLTTPDPVRTLDASQEAPRPSEQRWLEDASWNDPQLDEVRQRLKATGYAEAR
ncbi:MAG TPA: alkaline phosphatase family protein [Planctomycetota bacterium]|nr:alkaline phosphatase family protein [Planctomycetota bacterium]